MSVIRRRTPVVADEDLTRLAGPGRDTRTSRALGRLVMRGALVVAAATAALALAGPMALRPFSDVAGAAGEVTVAFVLDFGGSTADQVVGCVTVPSSDSRYDALTAFVSQEHLAAPTYAPSGLLCSINAIPSSGCGQVVSGGYIYWSYFTGDASGWTYSSTGAFGTVTPGDIEGWRFQDPGTGRPNDPAPRTAPDFSQICATGTGPTTTTTTVPGKVGGDRTRTHGGAGGGVATTTTHARHSTKGTTATGGTTGVTSTSAPSSGPSTTGAASTTPPTAAPEAVDGTDPPTTAASDPGTGITTGPAVGLATADHAGSTGSDPLPMIIGGLLIVALGVAAYLRWRSRTRMP